MLPEIVGLPPDDLAGQVWLGSSVQRRHRQDSEPEFVLVSATERALGQEPIRYPPEGHRIGPAGPTPALRSGWPGCCQEDPCGVMCDGLPFDVYGCRLAAFAASLGTELISAPMPRKATCSHRQPDALQYLRAGGMRRNVGVRLG
jgi:hypothetical protein